MRIQTAHVKGLLTFLTTLAVLFTGPRVKAQALLVETLSGGARLVLVNQPLADATTVVWPRLTPDGTAATGQVVAGRLTLAAEIEAAFGPGGDDASVPPVVVAVGGAPADELSALLDRVLRDRPLATPPEPDPDRLMEGGLDRRLGAPGSDAALKLEVALPSPGDWRRSAVEVLWELLPQLLGAAAPNLQSRVEGHIGVLEGRVDPELAEVTVSGLRVDLARVAADPALSADDVAEARRRLLVRRQAVLEEHPDAAVEVLERWVDGGENAVREYVFGIQAVTVESVRAAAEQWLPTHPGRAQLVLPPRVFNPRFAVGPEVRQLGSDLTVAVLERSGAQLAVLCLRPVLVPDLDGEVTATVLARMARELRSAENRPGFIRVRMMPPLLELAGPADGFGELVEQLTVAYETVVEDGSPVASGDSEPRRRALDLMSGVLGLTEGAHVSPWTLLRPGNLAVGVVSVDAEAAAEAISKFWSMDTTTRGVTDVQSVPTMVRTRAATPGRLSTVVVALELPFEGNDAAMIVTRELVTARARAAWPDAQVEVLSPFVPGRRLLLLTATAEGTVDDVEAMLGEAWVTVTASVGEDELTPVRRRVAAATSAKMSGVSGHARTCAAVAAGAARWRQPAELELELLRVDPVMVTTLLESISELEALRTTGAGLLPIVGDR